MNSVNSTIDILLFSSQNLLFGVYAGHIEELLTEENRGNSEADKYDDTIRYRQQKLHVIDFSLYLAQTQPQSDWSGSSLPDDSFSSPKILVIRQQEKDSIGIRVEHVLKFLTIRLDQIQSLPTIMQKRKYLPGLWGCVFLEERLVLLIDLTQFE